MQGKSGLKKIYSNQGSQQASGDISLFSCLIMESFIHILWLCCLVLVFLRLCFTFLFFVLGFVCLDHLVTVEYCGNLTLSQTTKNDLEITGTLVETGSTLIISLMVFSWGKFSPRSFLYAVLLLPQFWFWMVLFLIFVVACVTGDFRNGMALLGSSQILEIGTLVVFCCALKFINKVTVKRWLEQMFTNKVHLNFSNLSGINQKYNW